MNGGIPLAVTAVVAVLALSTVSWLTKDSIKRSEQRWIAASLSDIVPAEMQNEQWVDNGFLFQHKALGSEEALTVYPFIKDNQWQGAAITAIAPDGYTGEIRLLIAIRADHSLLGVRVIKHRETPGLGDDIEHEKSAWITDFDNQSLAKLAKPMWTVKKDGGAFDQFTGATITPRAVVHAVYRVLDWHEHGGLNALKLHFKEQT